MSAPTLRRITSHSLLLLPLALLSISSGCRKSETTAAKPTPSPTPARVGEADLQKHKPNEAGAIMVLMYHRVLAKEKDGDLNRRPDSLRRDLQMLRDANYHPVTALEMVENNMDVPIGKTPVVLTFDDALISQFRLITGRDGKAHIDPNCAVGIMETFHKKYPDWPTKATFFVLPQEGPNGEPFGQTGSADKFSYLATHGYEVANHTSTHANMRSMGASAIQRELATARREIRAISPAAAMQTLALPYGKLPRDKAMRRFLQSGNSGGQSYAHKAIFLAAWRPVLSPITRDDKKLTEAGQLATFNPLALERVKPDAMQAKSPGTFEYWLQWFAKNPSQRYVSDGMKSVVAVPVGAKSAVDVTRVQAQDKILQVYGGESSGKKDAGSSSLSVE